MQMTDITRYVQAVIMDTFNKFITSFFFVFALVEYGRNLYLSR